MKWGDLGGFCGFLNSGPPGGGPFWAPFWGPPISGRATKIEKVFLVPTLGLILGSRKSLQVRKSRNSLRIEKSSENGYDFNVILAVMGTYPNKEGAPRGPPLFPLSAPRGVVGFTEIPRNPGIS